MEQQLGGSISLDDITLFIGFGAFGVVGSVLIAKRPGNAISWIMITIGLMIGLFPAAETCAAYVMTTWGNPDALAVFGVWANNVYWAPVLALALIYLPLLFPNGRLPSRRWLPVALLTGLLASLYFGMVVALQQLSWSLTGQAGQSQAAIVISTLALAAIFNPLRGAIRDFIDRRFYRRRNAAEQTLQAFAAALRNEVDLDRLCDHLVRVIQETLQPEQASVWLKEGQERGDQSW